MSTDRLIPREMLTRLARAADRDDDLAHALGGQVLAPESAHPSEIYLVADALYALARCAVGEAGGLTETIHDADRRPAPALAHTRALREHLRLATDLVGLLTPLLEERGGL